MQVTGNFSFSQYYGYIRKNPAEVTELFKDLLISVTNFIRDPEAFKALEKEVIPKLFEEKKGDDYVRVWVSGCATGEEAYSIAILLYEYAFRLQDPPQVKIFATDISKEALKVAREGIYPENIETDVSKKRLSRFFYKVDQGYRVRKEIHEMVLFSFHDLLGDPPFSNLDLVACRNLLIYFNSDLQSEVLKLLHYALRPESFLFLGLSDSTAGASDLFAEVSKKKGIFKSRSFSKSRTSLPKIPVWKNVVYGKSGSSKDAYKKLDIQFDKAHYTLLAHQFAPASILINDNNEVMHASEGINRYLQFYEGEPSRNLFKMVAPELCQPLRGMIYQISKKTRKKSSTTKTVKSDKKAIHLTVQRVELPKFPNGFLQIIFKEKEISSPPEMDDIEQPVREKELIDEMESELE